MSCMRNHAVTGLSDTSYRIRVSKGGEMLTGGNQLVDTLCTGRPARAEPPAFLGIVRQNRYRELPTGKSSIRL